MISVCLPVYAQPIAWLAMEGLCAQTTTSKWELIIFEDEQYPNGIDFYKQYEYRLRIAGCFRVIYKYSPERISLSRKWKIMAQISHDKSIGILMQGGDNYPQPIRIQTAADKLMTHDWISSPQIIFYHVKKKKTILYRKAGIGVGSDMAVRKELMLKLPDEVKWSSVDSWIFNLINKLKRLKIYEDITSDWKNGVATDGANRISLQRHKMFYNPNPPFYKTNISMRHCVPARIADMLKKYEP